jgi:exodeoxyribonuclease-5
MCARQPGQTPPNISQFDLVIVDESSMVGSVFFADLLNYRHATLVLFVGDPAQLPPVGEAIRSPVFDRVQMQVTLSEVVRQAAENPIIALSMAVRAAQEVGVCMDARAILSAVSEGAYNIGACPREVLASWAIEEHKDGRDCRIIAYTNHRVLALNSDIHEALYGKTPTPFVTGERVIMHESRESVRSEDCPGVRVSLRTSEELIVRNAEWRASAFGEDLHLVVEREGGAKAKGVWLDPEKQAETQRRFNEAKEKTEKGARGRAFQSAFAYRESFLDLRHAYAMTVHKSQGSTFDTALIDLPDLQRMPQSDFNRALYVAITRPREFLGIGT